MMNIVGNQIIHEAADHYGWKEGSTEKLLLHGAIGALTGTMSGGNALSGAVSGSVNEFALAYMEKTKGRNWMDTHPDTVQAISTALGAVAGSLTGDRNTGAYTAQMGTKWNYYEKYPNMKEKIEKYLSSDEYKQQEAGSAHVIYLDDSTEHGVIITKDSNTGAGRNLSNEIFKNHRDIANSAGQFIGSSMGAEVAADLLRHALYGNGSPVSADSQLGQKISSDLNNSAILRAAIQSYGMKLKVGETKYIYGSVNLQVKDEYDNNATINGVLGYGRIKLGLQITRNENSIDYYGQASDAYNFEWHDVNSNLEKMKEDSSWDQFGKLIIDAINNGAAGYQEIGAIQAFDWSANLDGTIGLE